VTRAAQQSYLLAHAGCARRTGQYADCIRDCGVALSILAAAGDFANKSQRAAALQLRGSTHAWSGQLPNAAADFQAALASGGLSAADKQEVEQSLTEVRRHLAVQSLLARAANLFKEGRVEAAAVDYSHVISQMPRAHLALGNRAACWLEQNRYEECLQDCDAALRVLAEAEAQLASSEHALRNCPPALRQFWTATLLVRRGAALCWSGRTEEGRDSYERAAAIVSALSAEAQERGEAGRVELEKLTDIAIGLEHDIALIDGAAAAQAAAAAEATAELDKLE
jgi:tetratricopeptide (TPR) repeat protein